MSSPLDREIAISLFRNTTDTCPAIQRTRLKELDALVLKKYLANGRTGKEARQNLPLFKPGEFIGGRKAEHLAKIECVEGDYDSGRHQMHWIVARLMDFGISAYVHTTSSHTSGNTRCRIICPLSRPMEPEAWRKHFNFLNRALDNSLDGAAAKAAQSYFIGWLEGCTKPEIYHLDGAGCDFIDRVLERLEKPSPGTVRSGAPQSGAAAETNDDDGDDDIFGHVQNQLTADPELIRSMLSVISPDDHDVWIRVGLALHHELGSVGFMLWDEWSSRSPKYGETKKRWASFSEPANRRAIGIASVRKLALQGGWTGPETDPDIARLNARHALVRIRGKTMVANFGPDGSFDLGPPKDLHTFYENDRVQTASGRSEPVTRKWLRSPDRRTYPNGIIFAPGDDKPGRLNLWTGWKVRPDPAPSCELFLDHLRSVICAGDRVAEEYVLGWLAHLIQRPGEIPGVALVFRGEKGVGKDTFVDYLVPIIGQQHVPTVSQPDHVTGKFNARLETALVLHLQEGIWGGDRRAEQVLKYLVTSERIEIERKGVDSYAASSCLRLIISGNAEWIVPASVDERRFAVFDCSNVRRGDAAHFEALRSEMQSGGPSALLDFLMNYDLAGFDVRRPPKTNGLLEQMLRSLRGVEKWWYDCLSAGEILGSLSHGLDYDVEEVWPRKPMVLTKAEVRQRYANFIRSHRHEGDPLDERTFTKSLMRLLPGLRMLRGTIEGQRPWQFAFPKLAECRRQFELAQGHRIAWDFVCENADTFSDGPASESSCPMSPGDLGLARYGFEDLVTR